MWNTNIIENMKCPNCGQEIDKKSLFCEYCGIKIPQKKINHKKILLISLVILGALLLVAGGTWLSIRQSQQEYERHCVVFSEHLKMADSDHFFDNFINMVRDMREIYSDENDGFLLKLVIEPRMPVYMDNYRSKIKEVMNQLEQDRDFAYSITKNQKDVYVQKIELKMSFLQYLLDQSKDNNPYNIKIPEDIIK